MSEQRDKFLVEVGEGWCWHESSGMTWICGNCKTDVGWRGNNQDSVPVESLNPDFLKWENMGRLLELAKKKELHVDVWVRDDGGNVEARDQELFCYGENYISISDIPDITATLIAQALGFKGVKK